MFVATLWEKEMGGLTESFSVQSLNLASGRMCNVPQMV